MPSHISWRRLVQKFKKLGFFGPYVGGRHFFMIKDELKVRIPNRHQGDVSVALVKEVLRQADVTNDEWDRAS